MKDDYRFNYISSAATTQVKTGQGHLHAIVVGETTDTALQIIDGTSGTTTNLGELKASVSEGTYRFDCVFANGLRIVSGSGKYTVIYR